MKINKRILLLLILILASVFRFYNLTWDSGFHLHPDERFLTMVGNAMKLPSSFLDYLNPQTSTFNPSNIGFNFFVYGVFPLTLNKLLALTFHTDTYNDFTIQGRFLSGLADLLVVLLVYKIAKLFEKKYKLDTSLKYWAGFLYATSVLPIQLAHFFAVDTFLNLFMTASFYFALCFSVCHFENTNRRILFLILSAVSLGLAIASKINALAILPLNLFFILVPFLAHFKKPFKQKKIVSNLLIILGILFMYMFFSYFSVRFSDPYLFQNNNILNPKINDVFLTNIKSLKSFEGKDIWYPPAVQWVHKPAVLFSLFNLALFGIGLPYFFTLCIGLYIIFKKCKHIFVLMITFWTLAFFLYQSTQFVKAVRYFIFLYPFLAIIASFGLYEITKHFTKKYLVLVLVIFLMWPLAYLSIYVHKNSRIQASVWMYQNLPSGSVILGEHWDDPLPLPINNTFGKQFNVQLIPSFDPDTTEKWDKVNELLNMGDYLVFSSNRGWGSIPTVPERYPLMSQFYQSVFSAKSSYQKIKEFNSYPSLQYLGIPLIFEDQFADESFTVYDHPQVIIFQKMKL